MLKKVIISLVILIILVLGGLFAYVYTMDWNKQKASVAQKFSQITGLKTVIDGNLSVELFPTPQFTANKVNFYKTGSKEPLVVINTIKATTELSPLLNNNFIVKSMTLSEATVNVLIDEKGVSNWSGAGKNNNNKSGNIEVSFANTQLNKFTLNYKNLFDNREFTLPDISADVSAPSLAGPYTTKGKFIYNNSEFVFNGTIVNEEKPALNLSLTNGASGSKFTIDGTLGNNAKGNIAFDTKSLKQIGNTFFGEGAVSDLYNKNLAVSFKYDYTAPLTTLNNFAANFDNSIAGSGTVKLNIIDNKPDIVADFDLAKFDLVLIENLAKQIISLAKEKTDYKNSMLFNSHLALTLKSNNASYKKADVKNLSASLNYKDGVIDLSRLSMVMPGETSIKTVGKIDINNGVEFIFDQAFTSANSRLFAATFDIDPTKYAAPENKKNIFKKAAAEFVLQGNLEQMKLNLVKASIDSTNFKGNIGIVNGEQMYVLADLDVSTIIFDKYLQVLPENLKDAPLKTKLIHQFGLIPWNKNINVEGSLNIASAVYNSVPLEKVAINFVTNQEKVDVSKFSAANMAGASVNLSFNADKVFSDPYFTELTYDVKTANLPLFISTLDIDVDDKPLFKRKSFAAQGSLSGSTDAFSISAVQKFGDTEFAYTGTVQNASSTPMFEGDLELKSNNFTTFLKAVNLDYKLDIPVTTFTFSGKLNGVSNAFSLTDINAYLGANNITGQFSVDQQNATPMVLANLNFDRFDADKWLHFSLPEDKTSAIAAKKATFISQPEWSDEKIDYTPFKKINFNIKAASQALVFDGANYQNVEFEGKLDNSVLSVSHFKAQQKDSAIDLDFVLDANNLPKINGNFDLKQIQMPELGGTVYTIKDGFIDAKGSFNSTAVSKKEFWNSLNSTGSFKLTDTTVYGWDLDIIKFELEQRKAIAGFDEIIENSLKSGKSTFSSVSGKYNINKGVILAEKVLWESLVISMNMALNLNLSDWLFSATFNAIYYNASFSDVIKFSYDGKLSAPAVKTDFSESIKRITEIDSREKAEKAEQEKEKNRKLNDKITSLKFAVDRAMQSANKMALDVVRYKPVTDNKDVNRVYEHNLKEIAQAEETFRKLQDKLLQMPSETALVAIETELNAEETKLQFIPKVLEENYVIDSKYIYEEIFNKIIWLYNLAQNNFGYYNGVVDVYMQQIEWLETSENPVSAENKDKINKSKQAVDKLVEKINNIHTSVRDKYLTIVDATKAAEMKKNNETVNQIMRALLSDIKQLNEDIISSIDIFRAVLEINARDYDDFIIYPPENVEDIDIKQPTTKVRNSAFDAIKSFKGAHREAADDIKLSEFNQGLSGLLGKFKSQTESIPKQEKSQVADLTFNGLAQIIKSNINTQKSEPAAEETQPAAPVVVAEVISKPEETAENKDAVKDEGENASKLTGGIDILAKTQDAISKLMTQLTNTKKNFEALLNNQPLINDAANSNSTNTVTADNEKTVSELTNDSEENSSTQPLWKINPVIAMEMSQQPEAEIATLSSSPIKKTGFILKKKNENEPEEKVSEDAGSQSPNMLAVAQILTDTNKAAAAVIEKDMSDNAPVYTTKEATGNRYVFAENTFKKGYLNGSVGKSMLPVAQPEKKQAVSAQYVFAQSTYPLKLRGSSEKSMLLAVK